VLGVEIEVHRAKLAASSPSGRDRARNYRLDAEFPEKVLTDSALPADYLGAMPAARDQSAVRHTVETLTAEISRIVAERQDLRAAGATVAELEENRRRLAAAQNQLSVLLIERHLPAAHTG
jgi:hypothetical protein